MNAWIKQIIAGAALIALVAMAYVLWPKAQSAPDAVPEDVVGAVAETPPPVPAPSCPMGMVPVSAGTVDGHAVGAFCIDQTEVTVASYRECVTANVCGNTDRFGETCNYGRGGADDHPMNCVDWNNAVRYCEWRRGRLPTEWEWQFAAQGPDGREYPWGNEPPSNQLCWWTRGTPRRGTCMVGSFPIGHSPFGAEDMAGNVSEWTSTVDRRLQDSRVHRGGCWGDSAATMIRSGNRLTVPPTSRHNCTGFRCARGG